MISRLGLSISRLFARFMPDPFVLAVLLMILTFVLALFLGDFPGTDPAPATTTDRALALFDSWRSTTGLWRFLSFSMQMCLILVTGHALAASRPIRAVIERISALPRTAAQGAATVAAAACIASLTNWGLGLIAGAILALSVGRSLSRRGIPAHYPLLVAAGFAGFMVWHGGLSGSAPLTMTTLAGMQSAMPARTIEQLAAAGYPSGIPLTHTIFSPLNLVVSLGLLVLVPLSAALLTPRHAADIITIDRLAPHRLKEGSESSAEPETYEAPRSVADRLDTSRLVTLLVALPLLFAVVRFGITEDLRRIGLNEVNTAMFALGLTLHGSARSYLAAVDDAAKGCGGIILQFPLYGGILAMLVASGLDRQIAAALVDHASKETLPLIVFATASVLNFFIPSGGGQWAVQGPIALDAGLKLGTDPGVIVMSVAFGDQITNMLQPFWALPLLAVTGAKARDIVGYTALIMLAGGAWVCIALIAF